MKHTTGETALLVMDMQTAILGDLPEKEEFVSRVNQAISHARKQNISVLFIRVGFQKNAPEISANNKRFGTLKERIKDVGAENFSILDPGLDREEDDIIVTKHRISAFSGSDLEMILRANNITHLVLAGIATSGVVLSTLREAADMDFQLTVLADGCVDRDPEVHHVLSKKVFIKQADVIRIAEWLPN